MIRNMNPVKGEKNRDVNLARVKTMLPIALVLMLLMGAGLLIGGCGEEPGDTGPVDETGQAAETGDPENAAGEEEPGEGQEIVAMVNDQKVTRTEFEQVLQQQVMQYQMQGMDLESEDMSDQLRELEEQVLENYFITPILLKQKASEEGIEVSENEVEERYREYVAQFGGEEQLLEQMEALNLSRDELNNEIIQELTLQKYLEQYLDTYLEENPGEKIIEEEIEITTEDMKEQYRQLQEEYARLLEILEEEDPEIPSEQVEMQVEQVEEQYGYLLDNDFEDIKPELEEEMRREIAAGERHQKEQRILMAHVEELREEGQIEKNL